MVFALLVLVPILVVAAWAFLWSSPRVGNPRGVARFNVGVLMVGVMGCGVLTMKVHRDMAAGPDRPWWPVISALYSLALFPAVLLVGGLVRNLLVFRPPRATRPRP